MRPALLLLPAGTLVAGVVGTSLVVTAAQSLGALALTGDGGLSLQAYRDLLERESPGGALLLGASVAAAATVVAATVGLAVVVVVRATSAGGRVVAAAAALTVPVPHLVGSVAVALLLADSGMLARLASADPGTWPQLVGGPWWIAAVAELAWKESAFIALVVLSALPAHTAELDETAAVLGASRWRRFRWVLLPLASPGLRLAATVSFVYALGSYEVAWLLGPAYPETLPVLAYRLFTSTDLAVRPEAMAASLLLVLACAAVTVIGVLPLRRRWVDA